MKKKVIISILAINCIFFSLPCGAFANTTNNAKTEITYIQNKNNISNETYCISHNEIQDVSKIRLDFDYNNLAKRNIQFKEIIIHHSGTEKSSLNEIHEYHKSKDWGGIGYHYYIKKDGSILTGRPLDYVGAHCINKNMSSIGICLEGNFEIENPTEKQLVSAIAMSLKLSKTFGINTIARHKDYNSTDCPGSNFPWEVFKTVYNDYFK